MKKEDTKNFYITTTLPYVNADPHIGFAMEVVRADVIARYKRSVGFRVFFNTGTDEHGIKIYQRAKEEGKSTKDFVDERSELFRELKTKLNLSFDNFIRTTDDNHVASAQAFWKKCDENGFIYKKKYSGLYCVGCEMFLTEKDLINGECPYHPGKKLEFIEEENYFFKYSDFAEHLLGLYDKNDFIIPANRQKEIKNFVESGLEDFSISRLKSKMPWGVSVPGDDDHVMYVWFDALTNYISTLGWPNNDNNFDNFWNNAEVVQYCGKDNLGHQAARWQAMLASVGLKNSDHIVINGFINNNGQKMSKSLGNVINPDEVLERYGLDATRYFLASQLHPFEDSDFNYEKFDELYNSLLANGLGNVVSRVMKMAEDNLNEPITDVDIEKIILPKEYGRAFDEYNLQKVGEVIWRKISDIDEEITRTEPFKLVKTDPEKAKEIIAKLVLEVYTVAIMLEPIMPNTSNLIKESVKHNKKPESPLFLRKE